MHQITIKIGNIVGDDWLRGPKSADDAISNKICYNLLRHRFVRSNLDPFSEIINGYEDESISIRGSRLDRTYDIQTLSGKWPRQTCHVEFVGRNSYHVGMHLTLVAFLYVLDELVSIIIQKYPALNIFFARTNIFM